MIIPIKKTRVSPRAIVGLLVSLVACVTIGSLAYAELGEVSPDKDDSINLDTTETGTMSHVLKDEATSKILKTRLGAYYSSGPSGSGKSIQILWGKHGRRCDISNDQINRNKDSSGNITGGVRVQIIGEDTKTYYVPINHICDGGSTNNSTGGGSYATRGGNDFVASYPLPDKLLADAATGGYRVTVNVILDVKGNSSGNGLHFGFRVKAPGAKMGILGNGDPQEFGVLSADATDSAYPFNRHGIKYRAQFGVPCTPKRDPADLPVTVYDPDPKVFGKVYFYVTKRTAGSSESPRLLDETDYPNYPEGQLFWEGGGKRFRVREENVVNGENVTFFIHNVEPGYEYKLVIENPATDGKSNPADNVLSVSLPGDAINGDTPCEDSSGAPFEPIIKIREDVVEPADDDPYHVQGHVKAGPVEVAPGREAPKVPVELHRAIYTPNQATFGGGSNIDGPSAPYYGVDGDKYKSMGGSADIAAPSPDYWFPATPRTWFEEAFEPEFRAKDGSTTCFILAVQQPPTVKQWTYQYQVYVGNDKDGNPIYATYSATDYWYSDENYTTPGNATVRYHYDKVERTWVHAADCVTVGKRPKVQILGNDSRVRGDSKTKLTHYNDAYFGSWIEYGALSTKIDDAPASGAGYRNGTSVDVGSRMAWSKLTFANDNADSPGTYGDYTSLPAPPNIAGYYDERSSHGAPSLSNGSLSDVAAGTYRVNHDITLTSSDIPKNKTIILYSEGTVTISGNITYDGGDLTSLSQIPQVIIIAKKNINIEESVSRIDAWLIADGDGRPEVGNINTCSNGPQDSRTHVPRQSGRCNTPLFFNGPVIADALYLDRTGPAAYDAGAPAEIFNLRPDAYLWAAARQQSTGAARTVDIVELPPRF